MTGFRRFALIVVGLVVIVALFRLLGPRDFDWDATFAADSTQPFGCQLFDEVARASLPSGYELTDDSFFELLGDSTIGDCAVLSVNFNMWLDADEVSDVLSLARRGCRVLLAAHGFGELFIDSLGIDFTIYYAFSSFSPDNLKPLMALDTDHLISWTDTTQFAPRSYSVPEPLGGASLSLDSIGEPSVDGVLLNPDGTVRGTRVLAIHTQAGTVRPLAVAVPVGRGEIVFVSAPLLFTNYGVLHGDTHQLVFRLLSELGQRPVRRITLYADTDNASGEIMSFVKSQPPLSFAWRLALVGVVLFMLTAARRRQRAMPVVAPPQNHSLEFIRLIGTLYHQQGDNADLVRKKFLYTADRLRREQHVDVADTSADAHTFAVVARNAGLAPAEVARIVAEARRVAAGGVALSSEQMCALVDGLDALVSRPGPSSPAGSPEVSPPPNKKQEKQ